MTSRFFGAVFLVLFLATESKAQQVETDCGKAINGHCECDVVFEAQEYGWTQEYFCRGLDPTKSANAYFTIDAENWYGEGHGCLLSMSGDRDSYQKDLCHLDPGPITSKAIKAVKSANGKIASVGLALRTCGHPTELPPNTCKALPGSKIFFNEH